jgi:hypothetical protein
LFQFIYYFTFNLVLGRFDYERRVPSHAQLGRPQLFRYEPMKGGVCVWSALSLHLQNSGGARSYMELFEKMAEDVGFIEGNLRQDMIRT